MIGQFATLKINAAIDAMMRRRTRTRFCATQEMAVQRIIRSTTSLGYPL
jgi:hypothetical protein